MMSDYERYIIRCYLKFHAFSRDDREPVERGVKISRSSMIWDRWECPICGGPAYTVSETAAEDWLIEYRPEGEFGPADDTTIRVVRGTEAEMVSICADLDLTGWSKRTPAIPMTVAEFRDEMGISG